MKRDVVQADAFQELPQLDEDSGHVAIVDYPWEFGDRPGAENYENDEDWDMAPNEQLGEVLGHLADALVPGAWAFVFADDDVLPEFREAVEDTLKYRKTLIWDTERMGLGHYFRSRHGFVIAATNGKTDRYVQDQPTVLSAPAPQRQPGKSDTYPTEKPARLVEQLVEPTTDAGEKVLEPFCGSAPGLEAASTLNLRYWGVDVSEDAIARATDRSEQTTLSGGVPADD